MTICGISRSTHSLCSIPICAINSVENPALDSTAAVVIELTLGALTATSSAIAPAILKSDKISRKTQPALLPKPCFLHRKIEISNAKK